MSCIVCDSSTGLDTIEHIVNESLVNFHYSLDKGIVCKACNNKFSKFEEKALSKSILGFERARFGIRSKKGNPVGGGTGHLSFKGSADFKKYILNVYGLENDDIEDFDSTTGTFKIKVASFEKSEAATTKLILKIGLESIFKSQQSLYRKYTFSDLKHHLISPETKDWPLIMTNTKILGFKSVPRFNDKFQLKKNSCSIEYFLTKKELLVRFTYGGIVMIVNLLDRNIDWIKDFLNQDPNATVHPARFKNQIPI